MGLIRQHVAAVLAALLGLAAVATEVNIPSKKSRLTLKGPATNVQTWDENLVPYEHSQSGGDDDSSRRTTRDYRNETRTSSAASQQDAAAGGEHTIKGIPYHHFIPAPLTHAPEVIRRGATPFQKPLDVKPSVPRPFSKGSTLKPSMLQPGWVDWRSSAPDLTIVPVSCPSGWVSAGDQCLTVATATPATECESPDDDVVEPGMCRRIVQKVSPTVTQCSVEESQYSGNMAPCVGCTPPAKLYSQPLNPYSFRDKRAFFCVIELETKGALSCPSGGFELLFEPWPDLVPGQPLTASDDPMPYDRPILKVSGIVERLLLQISDEKERKTPVCALLLSAHAVAECSAKKCVNRAIKETVKTIAWWAYSRLHAVEDLVAPHNAVPGGPPQEKITHVIFDLDGTLLDTEGQYSIAADRTLKPLSHRFSPHLKRLMMGRKREEAVDLLLKELNLDKQVTYDQFNAIYDKHLQELLPQSPVLPGAIPLIRHLQETNIPLAICTGSSDEEFKIKTARGEPKSLVEGIQIRTTASDPLVKHGKPAPDAYIATMKKFTDLPPASPANVLVFEDAFNGVRAALHAGCCCVMIPQPQYQFEGWEEDVELLRSEYPDRFFGPFDSLETIKLSTVGLPDLPAQQ